MTVGSDVAVPGVDGGTLPGLPARPHETSATDATHRVPAFLGEHL